MSCFIHDHDNDNTEEEEEEEDDIDDVVPQVQGTCLDFILLKERFKGVLYCLFCLLSAVDILQGPVCTVYSSTEKSFSFGSLT